MGEGTQGHTSGVSVSTRERQRQRQQQSKEQLLLQCCRGGGVSGAPCLVCGHAALALGIAVLVVGAQLAVGGYLDVQLALHLARLATPREQEAAGVGGTGDGPGGGLVRPCGQAMCRLPAGSSAAAWLVMLLCRACRLQSRPTATACCGQVAAPLPPRRQMATPHAAGHPTPSATTPWSAAFSWVCAACSRTLTAQPDQPASEQGRAEAVTGLDLTSGKPTQRGVQQGAERSCRVTGWRPSRPHSIALLGAARMLAWVCVGRVQSTRRNERGVIAVCQHSTAWRRVASHGKWLPNRVI